MAISKPIAIDLFCGVGGMSLGFEQAGFDIVEAFDLEPWNVACHEKNFPHSTATARDLSKVTGAELLKLCGTKAKALDVVFGGPPCQGFSVAGNRDSTDERNLLLFEFARLIRELQPKYFVLENVRGLMAKYSEPILNSFLHRIRLAGYSVVMPIKVLNAADFEQ